MRLRVYCILVFTPGQSGENRIKFYRFWKGIDGSIRNYVPEGRVFAIGTERIGG